MMKRPKRVTHEVSAYLLEILTLFMPRAQIAKKMIPPVTPTTIYRWEEAISALSEDQMLRCKDLILEVAHRLERRPQRVFKDLAEVLRESLDAMPDYEYIAPKRASKDKMMVLREDLNQFLKGKPKNRNSVLREFESRGYKDFQIQRAASQLGVKKTVKGFGRNRRSFWSVK